MAIDARLRLQIAEFQQNYTRAREHAQRENAMMQQSASSGGGAALAAVGSRVLPALAALVTAQKAVDGAGSAMMASMERQAMIQGLAAVSAEDLAAQLMRLEALGRSPGLSFATALGASRNLQAVGFSASLAEKVVAELANAMALVGGSAADMDGVVLALTQMAAKGKITADDIMQIANRVPQIRSIMQEAFGTADTEALQKMGISAEEFVAKVSVAMEKLPRAMATDLANLERVKGEWESLVASIGDLVEPVRGKAMEAASGWIRALEDEVKQVRRLITNDFSDLRAQSGSGATDGAAEADEVARRAKELEERRLRAQALEEERKRTEALARKSAELNVVLDDLEEREIALLPDEEKFAAMQERLRKRLEETVGMFSLNYDVSTEGLRKLVEDRMANPDLPMEGQNSAEEALGWLKEVTEREAALSQMWEQLERGRESARKERESAAAELEQLRERARNSEMALLSPEEQAQRLRDQLSESLAVDVRGAADIERGLRLIRMEIDSARRSGDVESEQDALRRYEEANRRAAEFSRVAAGLDGGQSAGARGSFQQLVDEIFDRDPQQEQLRALEEVGREAREQRATLDRILKKMDAPPARDLFSFDT